MHIEGIHLPAYGHEHDPRKNGEARAIARDLELVDKTLTPDTLRYTRILETLRRDGLLEGERRRVQTLYGEELGAFGESLTQEVWELLTILELFDPETARHCVDTYLIAKSKVESTLSTGIVLADSFEKEGVDTKTFFTSCLLHDIGKIELPHEVVINSVTDTECANLLLRHKDDTLIPALRKYFHSETYLLPTHIEKSTDLLDYLHTTLKVRPQMLAPVRLLLGDISPDKREEIEKQLFHCGMSLNDSLLMIMRTHDAYTERILTACGMEIEGVIAGAHHISHHPQYTITVGTMQVTVDLAHIIHLADVENALMSARHYKRERTPLEALSILASHAEHGFVDEYITYLWIADELYRYGAALELTEDTARTYYERITHFLDSEEVKHPEYPDWRRAVFH